MLRERFHCWLIASVKGVKRAVIRDSKDLSIRKHKRAISADSRLKATKAPQIVIHRRQL